MAAGLGFKDFATGEVLTAADVDGYLMQGTWVFASAAARSSAVTSPQEGNMSYLKDTNSVEYYTGSAWAAVGGGGGGKVLQVIYAAYNTETNISGAFADIGLSASITPSVNTSKVLVLTNVGVYTSGSSTSNGGCDTKILRGATSIFQTDTYGQTLYIAQSGGTSTVAAGVISMQYLDSPATTSSTTYKVQGSGGTCSFQRLGFYSNMILMEIGA